MKYSKEDIEKLLDAGIIEISPYPDKKQFQPASVDLHIGNEFAKLMSEDLHSYDLDLYTIDPKKSLDECHLRYHKCVFPGKNNPVTLRPNEPVLGTTVEKIKLPNDICATIDGRSSFGRHFILVHVTAGFIDPGFEGQVTLEIVNLGKSDFKLYPGSRICQILFEPMSSPCKIPYGSDTLNSKYQNQKGVTESKLNEDDIITAKNAINIKNEPLVLTKQQRDFMTDPRPRRI